MADFRPETLSVLTAAVPFVIFTRFTIRPAGPYAPPDTADQLYVMEAAVRFDGLQPLRSVYHKGMPEGEISLCFLILQTDHAGYPFSIRAF